MSNPAFNANPYFGEGRGGRTVAPPPPPDPATLEQMYGAPSATSVDTGRMTYDDVIMKTAGMFVVLLITGALTWTFAPGLFWVGMIAGFVLGLVNAFKKQPSPALILAYAAAEGVFLGGLSAIFETMWPGIALQAVLATMATFAAALMLFRSGKVRVTAKSMRWFLVALGGYAIFSLVNVGLVWFGGMEGFGLRNGPIGIVIGLFAVGLAAYALIVDFDAIQRGVRRGAPAKLAWSAAFGLVVTLVWLYVEFLRILAILRGD